MTASERWALLAATIPDVLDELEAHWRRALDSGRHVEGDWRALGVTGNDRHRFDHARAWEATGNVEDLLGELGRAALTRQGMVEAARKEGRTENGNAIRGR